MDPADYVAPKLISALVVSKTVHDLAVCRSGTARRHNRVTLNVGRRRPEITRPQIPGVTGATQYEEAVMLAITEHGSHDKADTKKVMESVLRMQRYPGKQGPLNGDWQEKWNSNNGSAIRKTLLNFVNDNLPKNVVAFRGGFQRITESMFHDLRPFRVPGYEKARAAIVFSGPRSQLSGLTFEYHINRVRILPSNGWDTHYSRDMVQATRLSEFARGIEVDIPGYFELEYLSAETRLHRTPTGVAVVSTRQESAIEYDLE